MLMTVNTELRRAVLLNKKLKAQEGGAAKSGIKEKSWGQDGYNSDHTKYARYFGLPENYFLDFVSKKKIQNGIVYGLDVMSNHAFLRSLNIPGIAIGLSATEEEVNNAMLGDIHLLLGDLVGGRKSIWKQLDILLIEMHLRGFDLITLRGYEGLSFITQNPMFHFQLLQNMWKRLNEGGEIITEIPGNSLTLIKNMDLIVFWKSLKGIKVEELKNHSIKITKEVGAPKELPLNFTPTLSLFKKWFRQ